MQEKFALNIYRVNFANSRQSQAVKDNARSQNLGGGYFVLGPLSSDIPVKLTQIPGLVHTASQYCPFFLTSQLIMLGIVKVKLKVSSLFLFFSETRSWRINFCSSPHNFTTTSTSLVASNLMGWTMPTNLMP